MTQKDTIGQRLAIVKVMTVTKKPDQVFQFFFKVKNMENGGTINQQK
jgi:hypothetical protein